MASPFARSASGPSGLSINTGTANLFGSSTTAPNNNQPQAAGVLFGASAQTPQGQPAQSGALFGGGSLSNNLAQKTGGLFGNTQSAAATSQAQTTAGLFGSAAAPAQSQTAGGGLFGQPTSSLFGNNAATSQPQHSTSAFLGNSASASQPQQPMGGLFGSAAQSTTQGGGGLFGGALGAQSQQQQQQSQGTGALGGSMFGSQFGGAQPSAAGPSQNVLGQPALGAGFKLGQANGQQTVVPGVRIDVSNIRGTTRYNDLQEDLQKQIAEYDAGLQKFIKDKEAVDSFMPKHGELLAQIPHDVNFVTRKSDGAQHALASDVAAVNALRDLVKADAESAKLSFKAVDNLKLPSQYHQAGLWSTARPQSNGAGANGAAAAADAETSSDLISLFSRTAEEMEQTMRLYSQNLAEIESHLHGVQANLHGQMQRAAAQTKTGAHPGGADEKLAELAAFLREFEEGIFRAATQVGAAREGMTELQLGEFHG